MSKANGLKEHTENYDNKSDIGYTRLKQKWKKSHKFFFLDPSKNSVKKRKKQKRKALAKYYAFSGVGA